MIGSIGSACRQHKRSQDASEGERRRHLKAGLDALVQWFSREDQRWASRNLRLYRASIAFVVREQFEAGRITPDVEHALLSQIEQAPMPKPGNVRQETSGLKRKAVCLSEYDRVVAHLRLGDSLDHLAALFTAVNLRLGLRPVEWQESVLVDTTLIISRAKRTNGRALADVRTLDLNPVLAEDIGVLADVRHLIDGLATLAAEAGT